MGSVKNLQKAVDSATNLHNETAGKTRTDDGYGEEYYDEEEPSLRKSKAKSLAKSVRASKDKTEDEYYDEEEGS
jgi:hypothetical protein